MRRGPLRDLRVIEFAALGPAPFCGMLLSDLGADVIRIDRPGGSDLGSARIPTHADVLSRGRRSLAVDLKKPQAVAACLRLMERADVLIEGFRPGVMERLGLAPAAALARNPRLVYARMTGWGQSGPYAALAGHDLNYLSITGAAHAIGTAGKPVPPLNLVGDFGGGALYLAFGILAAIVHARASGEGQVVDCAMCDGVASLMASVYALKAADEWLDRREANYVDGGAYFYAAYCCADGKWISVAALEPKFYTVLLRKMGLEDADCASHADRSQWPRMRQKFAEVFASKTRAHWCAIMQGADACFAPVLDLDEAPRDAHNAARGTFIELQGIVQPAPAPKFLRTPGAVQSPPPEIGQHSREVLLDWGWSPAEVAQLLDDAVLVPQRDSRNK
jgi:alpha-methylacyl-CoA racemase